MTSKVRYTPVRPPRGSKVSKDTSGRLMNIIAELSVSKNNEDRKKKMQELKKDFQACDNRLVQLISGHRLHLSSTMKSFSEICSKVNSSRRSCRQVKEKLILAKQLLECKRDEIRKLYSESVEHREVVHMLKEINDLNDVGRKVEDFLKDKEYLEATELLVAALSLIDGKLSRADALKDLKTEVNALSKKLHSVLIGEIHNYLYKSPENVFLNPDSGCDYKSYDDTFGGSGPEPAGARLPVVCDGSFADLAEDRRVADVLDCVALLRSVSETVEALKENLSRELTAVVRHSTRVMAGFVMCGAKGGGAGHALFQPQQQGNGAERYFLDLLVKIIHQFRQVAVNHYAFCNNLARIAMREGLTDVTLTNYELADVYSNLEAAIELFIIDYLDLHSAASNSSNTAFAKVPTAFSDISSFFLRKTVVTRTKKQSLFKFEGSSHAINKKTYFEEKETEKLKEKGEESSDLFLVCPPSPKNITVIYKTLRSFITEIETALDMEPGTHCPLYSFVMDCVKVFLENVLCEINRMLERITLNPDSWNAASELAFIEAETPICNSAVTLNAFVLEMEELVQRLPDYSAHFLDYTCNALESYRELSHAAYRDIISTSSEDNIFSVTWAKDVSDVLKSLPNWAKLEERGGRGDLEESPEEVRFRNKEENEILFKCLYNKDTVAPGEIIADHARMRRLALLHESMEWFSSCIQRFAENLPDIEGSLKSVPEKYNNDIDSDANLEVFVGMSTKITLKKLAADFKDLADTCLLVIHLEIRAHCFYYLSCLFKEGPFVHRKEEEPEVLNLNTDLTRIDEAISSVLKVKKVRYLFEGLGELLSTILINNVSNLKKINENKVKKMGRNIFAIQQNLAGITMTREVALDRARQYLDLLSHSYEDILNKLVEEGPRFQEYEYAALIQLMHGSREGSYEQEPLPAYLDRLRQILDEVPVSV